MSKGNSGERGDQVSATQDSAGEGVIFMFTLSGDEKSNWFIQGLALEKQD